MSFITLKYIIEIKKYEPLEVMKVIWASKLFIEWEKDQWISWWGIKSYFYPNDPETLFYAEPKFVNPRYRYWMDWYNKKSYPNGGIWRFNMDIQHNSIEVHPSSLN